MNLTKKIFVHLFIFFLFLHFYFNYYLFSVSFCISFIKKNLYIQYRRNSWDNHKTTTLLAFLARKHTTYSCPWEKHSLVKSIQALLNVYPWDLNDMFYLILVIHSSQNYPHSTKEYIFYEQKQLLTLLIK